MDTDEKYRNDSLLEVELTDPWGTMDDERTTHLLNDDVPIDGYVHILYRDPDNPQSGRDEDGRWYAGSFPFRDHRKDDAPWAAFPDKPKGKRHPVWKWQNPEDDPHEELTLNPSIGLGDPTYLHCWIRDGELEWL